jgi:transposase-like protein
MTFLNDIWKKFKTPTVTKNWEKVAPSKAVFDAFQENQSDFLQNDSILANLKSLQALLQQPTDGTIDEQFDKINQYLGVAEAYELLRQERWPADIHCPHCRATELQRIPQKSPHSSYHHRYRCLNCQQEFGDETGAPMEANPIPLNLWMQCWVLSGVTDSARYIAAKLNLDLTLVERMLEQLKKFFNTQYPLERPLEETEWSEKSRTLYRQLNDELLNQFELLNQGAVTPKDTSEFRRQQNLRRSLNASTDPAPSSPHAKKTR